MIQTKARNDKAKAARAVIRAEFERERAEILGTAQVSVPAQPVQPVAVEQKPAQQPQQNNKQQHQHNRR